MNWDRNIDLTKYKITTRLIIERALYRGWKVCSFKTNLAILLIYPNERKTPIKIFSASPPQMSFPASKISQDKYITNQLLAHNNLPVPRELLIKASGDNITSDKELEECLSELEKLVVKPLDSAHGKGITTDITSINSLKIAINEAKTHSFNNHIIIQEQIEGIDIRVICIGYRFANAISRTPATVRGDGKSTVAELINITNTNGERGENYKTMLNTIPLHKTTQYLSEEKLKKIPEKDSLVQVIGVSNTGMGGLRYNITDNIPDFLISIAEKAAQILELPVCGIDFMVKRLPKKNDSEDELDVRIIEANNCPSLVMYDDLYSSEQTDIIDRYLDYINEGVP